MIDNRFRVAIIVGVVLCCAGGVAALVAVAAALWNQNIVWFALAALGAGFLFRCAYKLWLLAR